jgi:DUF1680 family protein
LATGDARFIDVLELSLYNSVLSGVSLAGTDYFYVNPLRNERPLPTELRWSRTRFPFVTSYCCPPNVLRTIAQTSGFAYAKQEDAVWVNLYGASRFAATLRGGPLELEQETAYPWDGTVRLTLQRCPTDEFALKLRIPGWAEQWTLRVNDEQIATSRPAEGYVEVRRQWRADDVLSLELAMPVQLLESHPLVEETRNQLAVKRGPIVYCLESPDLPADVRVRDVAVSRRSEFQVVRDFSPLSGVTVLEAELPHSAAGDWEDQLYRPIGARFAADRTANSDERANRFVRTRLVPYFTWSNRGESEMSVWLPRSD